mgnify:CR=1 FL=1
MREYSYSVFLNCPFDSEYEPLRKAIVFTIIRCGFIVRCADEDHTEKNRFNRILNMINESKYGIHDLSRINLNEGEMPRNNMPLELGIFIGSKEYKDNKKDYLVLDSVPHRYKQHTTDLGGQDPSIHKNEPKEIIKCVRDWLAPKSKDRSDIPSASILFEEFENFNSDAPDYCGKKKLIFEELTFSEYYNIATDWIKDRQKKMEVNLHIPVEHLL